MRHHHDVPTSRPILIRIIGALAVAAVMVCGALAPASAAPKKTAPPVIATANGTVGVAQAVVIVAPGLPAQAVTTLFAVNGVVSNQASVTLDARGQGIAQWAPSAAGTWTVTGAGGLASAASFSVTVAPVATRTALAGANQALAKASTNLLVTVTSVAGTYAPLGTVTIGNVFGGTYGTVTLTPGFGPTSSATLAWTTPSVGTYPLVATFTPSIGGTGVPNTTASSSSDTVDVVSNVPLVTLRLPSSFTLGQATPIAALISTPLVPGTAAFVLNYNGTLSYPAGSITIANQEAVLAWTPGQLGNQLLTADYTSTSRTSTGSSTEQIAVLPVGPSDPMSVAVDGLGVLFAATPVTAAGGQRLTVTTSSGSGSAVGLAEAGPCLLQGGTLVTPKAGGQCTLTAASPGGGAFGPNRAVFTVNVSARK
jgi:hypothetical protein